MGKNQSQIMKKRWQDPEFRKKISKAISKTQLGKKVSEETKKKMSTSHKNLPPRSKEHCENLSKSLKRAWKEGRHHHPQLSKEQRKKISIKSRQRWQDSEYREKIIPKIRIANSREDRRKKISKASRERWANPEYKKRVSQAISEGSKGKVLSEECKQKISEYRKAHLPKICMKGRIISKTTRKKLHKTHLGRKLPKEQCEKMSKSMKEYYKSKEARLKTSKATKKAFTPEVRKKISEGVKNFWADPIRSMESRKNLIKRKFSKPNNKEKQLILLLQKLFPNEYKYIGNGEIIIGCYNPDFINCNGQKKIIELYGDYWHRNDDPKDRIDYFKEYGFDTLIVWEHELKNQKLLSNKLKVFHSGQIFFTA